MRFELGIWEIAVLALLREAPMHPYQMRGLLRDRHKDEILALKKGSLYHAIGRLERAGLIEVDGTSREGRRPERTTYRIAAAGTECLLGELRRIVATPKTESSEFMAAMSFLVHLTPEEAVRHLAERGQRLQERIDGVSAGLSRASTFVQRINLVESEYLLATLNAELGWVRGLEEDIRLGKLTWNTEAIFEGAEAGRMAAEREKE
jgi:DNA-binding PadR family transcriptional regulator